MMKILVVDDDMATVEAIRESVDWKKLGIDTVQTAYNIEQAKKLLEKEAADIVVCDIEMPMGNGTELIQWIRERKLPCEFLFLTCHEDFRYASVAIEYQAAGYLVKPFNAHRMELELLRVVQRIEEKQRLEEESHYGKWLSRNQEQVLNSFWRRLLFRELGADRGLIKKDAENRRLGLSLDGAYRITGVRLSDSDQIHHELGEELLEFIAEKLVSEIVAGELANTSVVKKRVHETLFFLVVDWKETKEQLLYDRCRELVQTGGGYLGCQFTCCVGKSCEISGLADAADAVISVITRNVLYSGSVFYERDAEEIPAGRNRVLDLKQLESWLMDQDKGRILNAVKETLGQMSRQNMVNVDTLFVVEQEILQLIYAYLYRNGIQAAELFSDQTSQKIQRQAQNSVFDTIKWANYALSRTLDYENEVKRPVSLVEKVEAYIHSHYQESITREDIAGSVFLAPEYLAKLYKKQTGKSLKDYVNQYRVEQAKMLLKNGEENISQISAQVGYDNFSY
ncbi:MAG: response regulator, partial [Eubacteriales bacterium]|nr:response regulator [Eubacteriales bacterium]